MNSEMTVAAALNLARNLKYGPLPRPEDPTPGVEEAIDLIRDARRTWDFNWLTGEAAENVLCRHIEEETGR